MRCGEDKTAQSSHYGQEIKADPRQSLVIEDGFTLTELITAVCVLIILATLALPSLLQQLSSMEAKRVRFSLMTTLSQAKADSYVNRQNLIVCLSDSAGRCNKNSNRKILSFIDNNDNNHYDADVDKLLDEQNLDPRYGELQLRASAGRHHIKFFGDSGKPRGHFGHIKYCPTLVYNIDKYQVSFNQIGIIKFKPDAIHPTDCDGKSN